MKKRGSIFDYLATLTKNSKQEAEINSDNTAIVPHTQVDLEDTLISDEELCLRDYPVLAKELEAIFTESHYLYVLFNHFFHQDSYLDNSWLFKDVESTSPVETLLYYPKLEEEMLGDVNQYKFIQPFNNIQEGIVEIEEGIVSDEKKGILPIFDYFVSFAQQVNSLNQLRNYVLNDYVSKEESQFSLQSLHKLSFAFKVLNKIEKLREKFKHYMLLSYKSTIPDLRDRAISERNSDLKKNENAIQYFIEALKTMILHYGSLYLLVCHSIDIKKQIKNAKSIFFSIEDEKIKKKKHRKKDLLEEEIKLMLGNSDDFLSDWPYMYLDEDSIAKKEGFFEESWYQNFKQAYVNGQKLAQTISAIELAIEEIQSNAYDYLKSKYYNITKRNEQDILVTPEKRERANFFNLIENHNVEDVQDYLMPLYQKGLEECKNLYKTWSEKLRLAMETFSENQSDFRSNKEDRRKEILEADQSLVCFMSLHYKKIDFSLIKIPLFSVQIQLLSIVIKKLCSIDNMPSSYKLVITSLLNPDVMTVGFSFLKKEMGHLFFVVDATQSANNGLLQSSLVPLEGGLPDLIDKAVFKEAIKQYNEKAPSNTGISENALKSSFVIAHFLGDIIDSHIELNENTLLAWLGIPVLCFIYDKFPTKKTVLSQVSSALLGEGNHLLATILSEHITKEWMYHVTDAVQIYQKISQHVPDRIRTESPSSSSRVADIRFQLEEIFQMNTVSKKKALKTSDKFSKEDSKIISEMILNTYQVQAQNLIKAVLNNSLKELYKIHALSDLLNQIPHAYRSDLMTSPISLIVFISAKYRLSDSKKGALADVEVIEIKEALLDAWIFYKQHLWSKKEVIFSSISDGQPIIERVLVQLGKKDTPDACKASMEKLLIKQHQEFLEILTWAGEELNYFLDKTTFTEENIYSILGMEKAGPQKSTVSFSELFVTITVYYAALEFGKWMPREMLSIACKNSWYLSFYWLKELLEYQKISPIHKIEGDLLHLFENLILHRHDVPNWFSKVFKERGDLGKLFLHDIHQDSWIKTAMLACSVFVSEVLLGAGYKKEKSVSVKMTEHLKEIIPFPKEKSALMMLMMIALQMMVNEAALLKQTSIVVLSSLSELMATLKPVSEISIYQSPDHHQGMSVYYTDDELFIYCHPSMPTYFNSSFLSSMKDDDPYDALLNSILIHK